MRSRLATSARIEPGSSQPFTTLRARMLAYVEEAYAAFIDDAVQWGETDAFTEIGVWRLEDDTVHATYCHQSGPAYWIADLMPRDESRVGPGGDLRRHEADNPDVQWIMTAHFDSLSMQFIRNGERSTVRLSKTDEPVCLSRVRPHPDQADRG